MKIALVTVIAAVQVEVPAGMKNLSPTVNACWTALRTSVRSVLAARIVLARAHGAWETCKPTSRISSRTKVLFMIALRLQGGRELMSRLNSVVEKAQDFSRSGERWETPRVFADRVQRKRGFRLDAR